MKTNSTLDEAMKTVGRPLERLLEMSENMQQESVIRGKDKMVFIPAFTKREAAAELPRLDVARVYLAMERRQADALENLAFILLWLSSLFALAYCLSV